MKISGKSLRSFYIHCSKKKKKKKKKEQTVRFCAKFRMLLGTLGELAHNGNAQVEVFIHRVVTTFCPSILN